MLCKLQKKWDVIGDVLVHVGALANLLAVVHVLVVVQELAQEDAKLHAQTVVMQIREDGTN